MRQRNLKQARGFTLIELLVVVLIIGILAAIAVPQYFKIVEKGRVAEATNCFGALKGAQERYLLRASVYGPIAQLDIQCPAMRYFAAPVQFGAPTATRYGVNLVRTPAAPPPYGGYTIRFVYDTTVAPPSAISFPGCATCTTDLMPY